MRSGVGVGVGSSGGGGGGDNSSEYLDKRDKESPIYMEPPSPFDIPGISIFIKHT